ncbi:MAG: hypothetical protein AB7E76_13980 [Deferribacterales bacterium]
MTEALFGGLVGAVIASFITAWLQNLINIKNEKRHALREYYAVLSQWHTAHLENQYQKYKEISQKESDTFGRSAYLLKMNIVENIVRYKVLLYSYQHINEGKTVVYKRSKEEVLSETFNEIEEIFHEIHTYFERCLNK